ncbi:MAG: hypothetical protein AJITA_00683 [Acetilactobacillus jinshanensis]
MLLINKNKFRIRNTKKVLRKAGKNWITVSVVLLGLVGLSSAASITTHADTTANPLIVRGITINVRC